MWTSYIFNRIGSGRGRILCKRIQGFIRVSTDGQNDFRTCALTSGLVTAEDLDLAASTLRQRAPIHEESEFEQAQAMVLVELGKINRWQAEQLLAGRMKFTLGPYRMLDSIGQGGMGQVFKAEHEVMGRTVAVKVLPRHKSTPEAIASFTREIRAQARLDHSNLVRAFDAGHDGNVHFLVTEYVPGSDLRRLLRRKGPLSMSLAASIISQVALGLEHAHAQGLIHRDVKPGNVLVTPSGQAKLSDLGLVEIALEAGKDERSNKIVGTADYLSPEQIKSPRDVSPASDIYALGCTLYYAVTGKVPFPGGTVREKARAHCNLHPIDPRRLNGDLTQDFVDVIADMMHKDPASRISTAVEVVSRLSPWVKNMELVANSMPISPPPIGGSGSMPDTDPRIGSLIGDSFGNSDSGDHASQPTHPISAASEETAETFSGIDEDSSPRWEVTFRPPRLRAWISEWRMPESIAGFHPLVFGVLAFGGLVALAVLGSIVISLM